MGKSSRLDWEDFYYEGLIDPEYQIFDGETQKIHKRNNNESWNNNEKIKKKKKRQYVEDYSDEWYLKMKNGNIDRK